MAKKPEPINYGGFEWMPPKEVNRRINAAIKAEQQTDQRSHQGRTRQEAEGQGEEEGKEEMTEAEKAAEMISEILTWMREPDSVEVASLDWLIDWANRRPLASIGLLAVLMPFAPQDRTALPEDKRK
jgi:hypothetical protein